MNNELYHHGIKGMKWGVRKDRQTASQQRIAKNTRYRNKLANRASRKVDSYSRSYKTASQTYDDLKNNGLNSNAWREQVKDAYDYDRMTSNSVWIPAINYVANSLDDRKMQEYMEGVGDQRDYYKAKVDRWTKAHSNLMNMSITEVTSKKDIRSVYRLR